jgi:glucose/arabinose dehydrogenase
MARRLVILVVFLLAAAACAEEEPSGGATPEVVTTATTAPPQTITSTSTPPSTTSPTTSVAAASSTTSTTTSTTAAPADTRLALEEVARGFEQPVLALAPPGDTKLYVVDQPGRIWVIDDGDPEIFVDINEDVIFGGERGLLGLAFHPDFESNRRFFVNYTGDRGQTKVVEMVAAPDGRSADPASQQVLLEIDQPARNHNGGMIAFGPDGYLWVATGDGGGANDRFDHGQRTDTLLAALLRIDVANSGEYSIPPDNPFVDGGGAPEVWAYGLRNPWRFTIEGDMLFIADVGQNEWEEINALSVEASRGANFGWPIREATDCFRGPCDAADLVDPVYEYSHGEGCSVTGGFVYTGTALPQLGGHYFFSDYCSGWIRSLSPDGEVFEWPGAGGAGSVTSFGKDAAGEIYVVVGQGSVFRLTGDATTG